VKQVRLFLQSIKRLQRLRDRMHLVLLCGAQDGKALKKVWQFLEDKET